ncbi:MAG: hypothetical protein ACYTGZ_06265 [Planctomycetota bacterium]|jgi:hypothetical protein
MASKSQSRTEDIQEILLNAVEVQLAAFTAGIGFWSSWVQQASKFSEEAIRLMGEIQANPSETNRLLLEMTDVSRASLRAMTELPRSTAEGFIETLDGFKKSRSAAAKKPAGAKKKAKKKAKRRVRAKP